MNKSGKMIDEATLIEAFSSVKKLRKRMIEEKKKVFEKYFAEKGEVNGQLLRRYASTYRFWSYLNWALWKAEARLKAEENLRRGKNAKVAFHFKCPTLQKLLCRTDFIGNEKKFLKAAALNREIAIVAGRREWVKDKKNLGDLLLYL